MPIVLILFSNFKSVLFAIAKELSRGTGQPPLDNGPQIITPWTIAHRTITPRAIGALCQLPPGQLPHGKLTPVLIPSRSVASFHSVAHPKTSQLSELSNSLLKGFIFIYNVYFRYCSRNFLSVTLTGVDNYPADNFFLGKCACLSARKLSSRELSRETNFM